LDVDRPQGPHRDEIPFWIDIPNFDLTQAAPYVVGQLLSEFMTFLEVGGVPLMADL
jgi:hypothetical protein